MAATPGEVYKKHRSQIDRGNFFIFDPYLFVVIRVRVTPQTKEAGLFRKMKVTAFSQVLPRFARHRYPKVEKEWFELYFRLPSFPSFFIKKSVVVDKSKAGKTAYLVLAVPTEEVDSYIPDLKAVKNEVNNAFDNGVKMNLRKYSRLASRERLRLIIERLINCCREGATSQKTEDIHVPESGLEDSGPDSHPEIQEAPEIPDKPQPLLRQREDKLDDLL